MRRLLTILLAGTLLLAVGCGESAEDKAKKKVCNARSDVQKQVNDLQNLTLSTATVNGVKDNLNAITNDLKQIKDAQGDLNSERKAQVTQATQQFESQLNSIVQSVGSSKSLSDAAAQLKPAVNQLASSYKQTLAKVDCS
jgi:hypothetical protein